MKNKPNYIEKINDIISTVFVSGMEFMADRDDKYNNDWSKQQKLIATNKIKALFEEQAAGFEANHILDKFLTEAIKNKSFSFKGRNYKIKEYEENDILGVMKDVLGRAELREQLKGMRDK